MILKPPCHNRPTHLGGPARICVVLRIRQRRQVRHHGPAQKSPETENARNKDGRVTMEICDPARLGVTWTSYTKMEGNFTFRVEASADPLSRPIERRH